MPQNRCVRTKRFLHKLKGLGVEVIERRGKGSHVLLKYERRTSTVPYHKGKDLDRSFLKEICKQLGLDPNEIL